MSSQQIQLPAPLGSCLGCSPPADFSVWQRFSLSFGSSSPGPTSSKRTTPRHSGSGLPPAAFFHHHHGSAQSSWSTPPSTSQRGAVQAEVRWIAAWAVEREQEVERSAEGADFFRSPPIMQIDWSTGGSTSEVEQRRLAALHPTLMEQSAAKLALTSAASFGNCWLNLLLALGLSYGHLLLALEVVYLR